MSLPASINVLFLGDVIGKPGRRVVCRYLKELEDKPDLIIANVENAAHGFGLTQKNMQELADAGVMVFTGGNHTFDRKEIFEFIDQHDNLLRPANYPSGTPGRGSCIFNLKGISVGILNLQGRIFMEPLDSPFLTADALLPELAGQTKVILVDIHAEATAEKIALAWHLDGRVSLVVGSHTHVQTADERILPGGTAYITDAGCCGPVNGVIGMDRPSVMRRMIQQLPARFEVAPGPAMLNGISVTISVETGKATAISRVHFEESDIEDSCSAAE